MPSSSAQFLPNPLMPQFNLQLSDKVLCPEDEASVRALLLVLIGQRCHLLRTCMAPFFVNYCAWTTYDSHIAAQGLRILAAQRMVLYADALDGTAELPVSSGFSRS